MGKNETRTSSGSFALCCNFFGTGWLDIVYGYVTQVFAVAGSEGIVPPYSLLSMSLSVLPLCSVLLLGRDE